MMACGRGGCSRSGGTEGQRTAALEAPSPFGLALPREEEERACGKAAGTGELVGGKGRRW